jgi:hypothetical protein
MDALVRALEERGLELEVTRPISYGETRQYGDEATPSNVTRVLVAGE